MTRRAPVDRFAATQRRLRAKLEVMQRLGAPMLLICSSVAPDTIDDDLAAAQLHTLADLARDHGVRIAYEALAWGRHVSTWEHSWEIVRRADHPSLGLCLDSSRRRNSNRRPDPQSRVPKTSP